MLANAANHEFSSWGDICRSTERKKSLKQRITKALKDFGLGGLSDSKIFKLYTNDLIKISNNCDGEVKLLLLTRSKVWSNGRAIFVVDEELLSG